MKIRVAETNESEELAFTGDPSIYVNKRASVVLYELCDSTSQVGRLMKAMLISTHTSTSSHLCSLVFIFLRRAQGSNG